MSNKTKNCFLSKFTNKYCFLSKFTNHGEPLLENTKIKPEEE